MDTGGCEIQKQEIHEAVELPVTQQEVYKEVGIDPPDGGPSVRRKCIKSELLAKSKELALIFHNAPDVVPKHALEIDNIIYETLANLAESSLAKATEKGKGTMDWMQVELNKKTEMLKHLDALINELNSTEILLQAYESNVGKVVKVKGKKKV